MPQRIAAEYGKNRTEVEAKVGLRLKGKPLVVLTGDNSAFQEMARNKLVTAFAVPEKNLIVIDYSKMDRVPFDLRDTFKHELTHLLLHQNIEASILPKWLDEGVAQWASGGMADIMRTGEKALLQKALLSNHMIPLGDISRTFPGSPSMLVLSYEESKSFVEFLVKRCGEEKLLSVLRDLADRRTAGQAFHENCGVGLEMLEQLWKKSLHREYTWISYAADNIYWLLFFFSALVTMAAWWMAKRRRKNYRDDEGEGEGEGEGEQQGD
ncbi:MAG: peptidase MA family metallohydrolase [Nitrospirota bacterium]|nr:peptidase MA family metallohydrolase [Nitrospirota bacterium]